MLIVLVLVLFHRPFILSEFCVYSRVSVKLRDIMKTAVAIKISSFHRITVNQFLIGIEFSFKPFGFGPL